jgi:hypothetical protein
MSPLTIGENDAADHLTFEPSCSLLQLPPRALDYREADLLTLVAAQADGRRVPDRRANTNPQIELPRKLFVTWTEKLFVGLAGRSAGSGS